LRHGQAPLIDVVFQVLREPFMNLVEHSSNRVDFALDPLRLEALQALVGHSHDQMGSDCGAYLAETPSNKLMLLV